MKHYRLLPHRYKKAGWILLLPSLVTGLIVMSSNLAEPAWLQAKVFSLFPAQMAGEHHYFSIIRTNLMNTILGVLFICGGLLVAFSREKQEDEFIASLRLSSLLWAVLFNYLVLMAAFLLIYDTGFFMVMVYNMFTVLILFIARFHYMLYRTAKMLPLEK